MRCVIQIDKYKTVRENSLILVRYLKQKNRFLGQEILEFKSLEMEIEELKNQIKNISGSIDSKQREANEFKSVKETFEKKLESIEKNLLAALAQQGQIAQIGSQ